MKVIEIDGLEALKSRFSDPTLIGEPLQELLEDASLIARNAAESGIDGGLGIAVRSINREVKATSARVYTALPAARAFSIEKGRPSGEPIRSMIAQLIRWREAVGHPDSAAVIARDIHERGTQGKRYMRKAREQTKSELPRLINKMAAAVEEKWRQGR